MLACSALRQQYRDRLEEAIPPTDLRFVLLEVPKAVLQQRLAERKGHYMNPALLDSQLATLEAPRDAIRVSGAQEPDDVVQAILDAVRASESRA